MQITREGHDARVSIINNAVRASVPDPQDTEKWDRVLTEVVTLFKVSLLFYPTIEGTVSRTYDPQTRKPNEDEYVLVDDYVGQAVTIVDNTDEVTFGDGEPLWLVQAQDGTIFAAYKSEVGL